MGIGVLGGLSTDAGALGPRERSVLTALAVSPGREVRPGELAEACWGDAVPRTWPKQVQALVSHVRHRLGPRSIRTTTQGYALAVDPETIDAVRFERLVERAHEHRSNGDPERAVAGYEQALALWRGPPFSDVAAWPPASAEAARLEEIRRAAEEDLLDVHLECGEHHSVIADAERLVRAEPLSERRWAILALALYRSGRQADALAALRRMRAELEAGLGVDPGPEISELETRMLRQDPRLDPPTAPRATRAGNPYKGLHPFTPDDAADFFGRDAEIADVLDRLDRTHLVAVVGPSGGGKSSLVLAGVVPRLRERGRTPALITPGTGRRTGDVLIVDQFEELFQLGWSPGEVADYCTSVADVVAAGHDVILTVRSDALDRCVADPRLGPLVRDGLVVLAPPSADALRLAIEEPARFAGLRVEHGLTELILRDAVGEPGVLPHLSHALAETWQRREGSVLTVEAYETVGGISGSIARSAEELYASLTPEERIHCHALLRRLLSLTPDGHVVQHRVAVGPLRADPHRSAIITRLVGARLVSVSDATISVAHESLATAWPRLHAWLEEDAEGARILEHLSAAAQSWDEAGRAVDELYRGARLRTALEWSGSSAPDLTSIEADFLEASAAREFADERRTLERARREQRQNRFLRVLLASAAVLVVASVAATVLAVRGGDEAARRRESADVEALVGTSLSLRSSQRAVAALLAVEAQRRWPDDPRSRASLMGTFTAAPGLLGTSTVTGTDRIAAQPIPGTDRAVVLRDDGTAAVYEIESAALVRELGIAPSRSTFGSRPLIGVSADGSMAVIVRALEAGPYTDEFIDDRYAVTSELIAVELSSGEAVARPARLSVGGASLAIDPTGSLAAVAGFEGGIRLVDLASMHVRKPPGEPDTGPAAVAFLDDGRLAIGSSDTVTILDAPTFTVSQRSSVPPGFAGRVLEPAGSAIVTAGESGIAAVDEASGALVWQHARDPLTRPCTTLVASTARGAAWCVGDGGIVVEHDLETGVAIARLPQHAADVFTNPDGSELVIVGAAEPVLSRWALDGRGAITRVIARGTSAVAGYGPDGSAVLVEDPSARLHVWDARTDASRLDLPADASAPSWAGADTVLVDVPGLQQPLLLDVASGRYLSPKSIPALTRIPGWASPSGHRLYVVTDGDDILSLDPATGERIAGPRDVGDAKPVSITPTPDDTRLLVTTWGVGGVFVTRMLDAVDGTVLSSDLEGPTITTLAGDTVVGAEGTRLLTYAIDDFAVTGSLPIATTAATLQASTDGRTLLVTGIDGSASLFDLSSGMRLGDAIPSAGGSGLAASLRPDGSELALALADGVQLWDLDPANQADAACRIAGRDLTREEWDEHLGSIAPYRSTCGFDRG